MIFTASKDSDKVNQILPILKEHFGNSINLARLKFMSLLLHALVIAQTVSLHKLSSFMPAEVSRDSNMRRIQRFLSGYSLNMDLIARMIFSLLPVKEKIVLSMDRTNWKFGKFNINILMLGITYRNVAFPILFKLMPKRGNSKWTERKELVERCIKLCGKDCIDCLVADREFVGKEWVGWLNSIKLRYYLRVRKNFKVAKGSSNTEIKVIHLVCHLKVGEYACSSCRYNLKGNMVILKNHLSNTDLKKLPLSWQDLSEPQISMSLNFCHVIRIYLRMMARIYIFTLSNFQDFRNA